MNEINLQNVMKESNWCNKLVDILHKGNDLDFFESEWHIGVNQNSGYFYLWSEDKPYQLVIKPGSPCVWAYWESEDGIQYFLQSTRKTSDKLDKWAEKLRKKYNPKD